MKKHSLMLCLFFVACVALSAQDCPANIGFETQAQIDSFPLKYPDCTHIPGNVSFGGYYSQGITNLDSLIQIDSIGGDLSIEKTFLTSLNGLDSLSSIGGHLYIYANDSLTSLNGLEHLTFLGGELQFYELENLSQISALSGLTYIDELYFDRVYRLINLDGLQNVSAIGGSIYLEKCYFLSSLSSLKHVTAIDGQIYIESTSISSLDGLDNIDASGITSLTIIENQRLTSCAVQSVCEYLADSSNIPLTWIGGEGDFHSSDYINGLGCNSQEEIRMACPKVMAIEENDKEALFRIYPNPSSGILSIEGISRGSVSIVNQWGQVIMEISVSGSKLDLRHLPDGIYYVKVQANGQWSSQTIVKN